MELSFLGIGKMGYGMARNLLDAGARVCVYNRTRTRCAPLEALGARAAETPEATVIGADIVFTMLSDDAALNATMRDEVIACMKPGAVHVSMSTISPMTSAQMEKRHIHQGSLYLACPVFGRPDAAAAGQLRLCLSGDEAAKKKVAPHLKSMGEVWDFGASPGNANVIKLAGNFMLASLIELLGEAYTFVESAGGEPALFHHFISSTMLSAPAVKNYGQFILDADFDKAGFTATLGAKDIRLVRDTARAHCTPLPIASLLEDRFLRTLARGWAEKDWSSIIQNQRDDAGLPTLSPVKDS
ncbi:MAG: NAD(P)-dependent oxidoreductase [Burkholderiaceae bacterium]|jgi:3-hydroxyisobutyrate dehydrogenase-like beta-hydroxyacid dehydrogenase|nr:NAD(P)-dependent oxidoreductase [Burkholderiaceae bacterium]